MNKEIIIYHHLHYYDICKNPLLFIDVEHKPLKCPLITKKKKKDSKTTAIAQQ